MSEKKQPAKTATYSYSSSFGLCISTGARFLLFSLFPRSFPLSLKEHAGTYGNWHSQYLRRKYKTTLESILTEIHYDLHDILLRTYTILRIESLSLMA